MMYLYHLLKKSWEISDAALVSQCDLVLVKLWKYSLGMRESRVE